MIERGLEGACFVCSTGKLAGVVQLLCMVIDAWVAVYANPLALHPFCPSYCLCMCQTASITTKRLQHNQQPGCVLQLTGRGAGVNDVCSCFRRGPNQLLPPDRGIVAVAQLQLQSKGRVAHAQRSFMRQDAGS